MAFNQTQRIDQDPPRDEKRLRIELEVESQTSVPRCDVGRNGDGRLPPGKHVVEIYESDLASVEAKLEKFPAEVERAKRENIARRHDFIRAAKTGIPDGYKLPESDATTWDGIPLPGIEGEVADAVRSAAWRYPGCWGAIYRESGATRNPDGSKRGPGTIRAYKILDTLPPPVSADAQHAKDLRDAIKDAIASVAAAPADTSKAQQNRR